MPIDKDMFDKLASVSHLAFSNEEKPYMIAELNEMIAFLEQIGEIDIDEDFSHCNQQGATLFMRDDCPKETMDIGKVERNAPNFVNGYFVVKKT